jgi:hypothetical protein
MQFLVGSHGQDALNQLIQEAVLRARSGPLTRSQRVEDLDNEVSGWTLPPGVASLGRLVALHPSSFTAPLLTTNFDPLLEVSIRRAGRKAITMFLTNDGRFDNVVAHGAAAVVHVHGYWVGSDTLPTPQQLAQPRPKLSSSRRKLLSKATLVVIGYGAWDDVFTRTLVAAVNDGSTDFNVLWAFYPNDAGEIEAQNQRLFDSVRASNGTRLVFYRGIDCHEFLPQLTSAMDTGATTSSHHDRSEHDRHGLAFQDFHPSIAAWVGRKAELERFHVDSAHIVAITGIGGQVSARRKISGTVSGGR